VTTMGSMFLNVTLSTANYDALLIGWATQPLANNVFFTGGNSKYCAGAAARQSITNTYGWTITDGGILNPAEINLQGNGQNIISGDSSPDVAHDTDFGTVVLNTPTTKTYTIQNTGTSNLSVASIALSGVDVAAFIVDDVTLPSTIAAGASATFTITLTAATSGVKSATVTITSDDCDESIYVFSVQGSTLVNPTGVISGDATICAGLSTQLSIALTGESPWFGTLSDGTGFSGGDNPLFVTVTPSLTTIYTIATLSSGTATASTADLSGSATVTVGALVTYYADADGDGYGNAAISLIDCTQPIGYVANSTDCDDALAAVNPGHVEVLYNGIDDNCDGQLDEGFQVTTVLQSVSCGATLTSIGSLIYANINLDAAAYRFKVVNNTTGDIQYVDNTHQWFALNWLASYDYNTAYTVSVQLQIAGTWLGYYGTTCSVNTPNITSESGSLQLVSTQCGATLPSIASVIYTTAQAGATGYRFRITDVTPNVTGDNLVQVKDRSYHWFTLPMLTRYNYGSTYIVEVAVKTTGGYTGYGSPCYVYTPASPMLNNCGAVIPTSRTLVYTAITKSVTQYRFQVTRVSDQTARTFDTGRFWFSFKVNMPGYTPSVAYSVRVAVMTAGTWSPFGDACEITSPAIPRTDINAEFDFNATVFPNPYSDQFGLRIDSDSFDPIAYKVYDMLGKLIEAEEVEFNALETKEFGQNYPAGVYNIVVSQGEDVKSLRVIKR